MERMLKIWIDKSMERTKRLRDSALHAYEKLDNKETQYAKDIMKMVVLHTDCLNIYFIASLDVDEDAS